MYRREIDGLRAVAVVPVILFHAGLQAFSGGYVGVDIFFVISGYLITGNLLESLQTNEFTFAAFYERRARRILPALFFVILCCIPFAWMWMLPAELENFSRSLIAVVFMMSNVMFWRGAGYFAPDTELSPLLHTWSLAVEEQFYLFFPIFLLLAFRLGRHRLFWLICVIAVISLAGSEWAWRDNPIGNFYLAPTRAWELLAGSLCAFRLADRQPRSDDRLALPGLALILFAIFRYDNMTPFPGLYALAPVLGASLIILFGQRGTWTARMLGMRGMVGIGLISYSAYLWHQPLLAFARIRSITEPAPGVLALMAALSMVLAYFTWRYIEKPFRRKPASSDRSRRTIALTALVGSIVIASVGLMGLYTVSHNRLAQNKTGPAIAEERIGINFGIRQGCDTAMAMPSHCRTSAKPDVLLWGDSFAMHLAQGIVASDPQVALQQNTMSGCPPLLGLAQFSIELSLTRRLARRCMAFNDETIARLAKQGHVKTVILSMSLKSLMASELIDREGRMIAPGNMRLIRLGLADTVRRIRALGIRVLVVSPPPSSGRNNGLCFARAAFHSVPYDVCDFPYDAGKDKTGVIAGLADNIPVYWLRKDVCEAQTCKTVHDGIVIFKDRAHLSNEGSAYLGRRHRWMQQFRQMAR